MQPLVVMAQPQRETVGEAPRLDGLFARQIAAWQGNAEVLARLCRAVRTPRDFDLGFMRQRTAGTGQRLLEAIERGLFGQVTRSGCSGRWCPSP